MKKGIIIMVMAGSLLIPSLSFSESYRWGRKLVQVGDSAYSVLKKCGRPAYREQVSVGIDGMGKSVEKLTYDPGYRKMPHTITIRDGKVTRIKNDGLF